MQRETIEYIQTGIWNRQGELLSEARAVHLAARAAREARSAAGARRQGWVAVARAGESAWRSVVGRLGSGMVSVGRRLEGLACRAAT